MQTRSSIPLPARQALFLVRANRSPSGAWSPGRYAAAGQAVAAARQAFARNARTAGHTLDEILRRVLAAQPDLKPRILRRRIVSESVLRQAVTGDHAAVRWQSLERLARACGLAPVLVGAAVSMQAWWTWPLTARAMTATDTDGLRAELEAGVLQLYEPWACCGRQLPPVAPPAGLVDDLAERLRSWPSIAAAQRRLGIPYTVLHTLLSGARTPSLGVLERIARSSDLAIRWVAADQGVAPELYVRTRSRRSGARECQYA